MRLKKHLLGVLLGVISLVIVTWPAFATSADDATALLQESRSTATANQDASGNTESSVSGGDLTKLEFSGSADHYTLNGFPLSRIKGDSIDLKTGDRAYALRANFLRTIVVSQGRPLLDAESERIDAWAAQFPPVKTILEYKHRIGLLKLIVYDLITPKDRRDLKLKEKVVLLWSSDPAQAKMIGETLVSAPVSLSENVVDLQYRGRVHADRLISNAYLQILYLEDGHQTIPIGAFVIVAKSGGSFEFYLAPQSCLDQLAAS